MDINHLLKLARLKVGPEEASLLRKDLEAIVEYVSQLSRVKTSDVEPMTGGTDLINIMRADNARLDSFKDEQLLLDAAPEREGDFFKAPRILE